MTPQRQKEIEAPEAPVHYNNEEYFAWQDGYISAATIYEKRMEEKDKEINRIIGLLKSEFYCFDDDCKVCNKEWKHYKKENNL